MVRDFVSKKGKSQWSQTRRGEIHQYVSILPFGEDSEKAANRKVQRILKNVKVKWIGT